MEYPFNMDKKLENGNSEMAKLIKTARSKAQKAKESQAKAQSKRFDDDTAHKEKLRKREEKSAAKSSSKKK